MCSVRVPLLFGRAVPPEPEQHRDPLPVSATNAVCDITGLDLAWGDWCPICPISESLPGQRLRLSLFFESDIDVKGG